MILKALGNAITDDVVAVLLEPIQGESGVRIPPAGLYGGVRELTSQHRVLFIADDPVGTRAYRPHTRLGARERHG